jgi:hypothetical protein
MASAHADQNLGRSVSICWKRKAAMHRSSESIAALAAALAKAPLSNPEKSLVATIGADRPGEARTHAPDLNARPQPGGGASGRSVDVAVPHKTHRPADNGKEPGPPILDADASAALRDLLMREIMSLGSVEDAGQWARAVLAAKNTLTASDARLLGVAFQLRLSALEIEEPPGRGPGIARAGRAGGPFVGTLWSGIARPRARQRECQGCCGASSEARRHR